MTEDRVGFLCAIASNLSSENKTLKTLRSYYLMRCNELTKGYGLPAKSFSSKVRCPHCCFEWTRKTEVNVRPVKLSKSQRHKIRSCKKTDHRHNFNKNEALLPSNEIVQICSFCKQSTTTQLIKPDNEYIKLTKPIKELDILKANIQKKQDIKVPKKSEIKKTLSNTKPDLKKSAVVNVYSNAFDVFSLKNEKNTLSSAIKESPKVIKNNKRKKDKFAGLCQKAVLASARLKQQKSTEPQIQVLQNKLNLFLKPSSG